MQLSVIQMSDVDAAGAVWLAALVLVIYDFCITFGDEVNHIWSAGRPMTTRLLYSVSRYWPMMTIIVDSLFLFNVLGSDTTACRIFFNWYCYSAIPAHVSIAAIQLLKLHAMYQCDRKMMLAICAFFGVELVVAVGLNGYISSTLQATKLLPGMHGCMAGNHASFAWSFWVPSLAFESTLLFLALVKFVQEVQAGSKPPHLMVVLLRDSALYFGVVVASIIVNLVMWTVARPSLFDVALPFNYAVPSLIGSRMLLNIQKASSQTDPYILSMNMTQSPLEFTHSTFQIV